VGIEGRKGMWEVKVGNEGGKRRRETKWEVKVRSKGKCRKSKGRDL
jgi:hypothetical protein